MPTIVITGNARGFGFEMTKLFYQENFNVVLCDISKENLLIASKELQSKPHDGKIISCVCDVTDLNSLNQMIETVLKEVEGIDIWINNAGVNQPNEAIWDLDQKTIDRMLDVDLKGTIYATKAIIPHMIKRGSGQIYNVEGYGSNDATQLGLSIYGTTKRAITYFTEALAKEVETLNLPIKVGKITPGIMITNFITTALGDGQTITLDPKTKKVYNILGDYPETIAAFMVPKIIANTKNNVQFTWLTSKKAAWRFMSSAFIKRELIP